MNVLVLFIIKSRTLHVNTKKDKEIHAKLKISTNKRTIERKAIYDTDRWQ